MLNWIWFLLMVLSVVFGAFTGRLSDVAASVPEYAKLSINLAIGLAGMMIFWLGIMEIAHKSGLINIFSRLLKPIMTRLFPEVPAEHPAMGAMVMNIAANMLGLVNAATPFGLKAMKALDKLNQEKGTATNAMCMFLAINTSSVQLIPMSAIAYLAAGGNPHPTEIISTAFIATLISTTVAITLAKLFEKYSIHRSVGHES